MIKIKRTYIQFLCWMSNYCCMIERIRKKMISNSFLSFYGNKKTSAPSCPDYPNIATCNPLYIVYIGLRILLVVCLWTKQDALLPLWRKVGFLYHLTFKTPSVHQFLTVKWKFPLKVKTFKICFNFCQHYLPKNQICCYRFYSFRS